MNRYPVPPEGDDGRFTVGLIRAVADVLEARGYPPITTGDDYVRLQQALYRFLYVPDNEAHR